MTALFQRGRFISAAGNPLLWKIECDALSDEDWMTIAEACTPYLPEYGRVVGVPRGGMKLARIMAVAATPGLDRVLVVDDVWTTGKSMLAAVQEFDEPWFGLVAFARGKVPHNVAAFMQLGIKGGLNAQ